VSRRLSDGLQQKREIRCVSQLPKESDAVSASRNRQLPGSGGLDTLNTNTPSVLGQGNNHVTYKDQLSQMGEGKAVWARCYLYYYESTGAESSNCELTGPDALGGNVDFHIGIGFDQSLAGQVNMNTPSKPPKQLQQQSVIVEMTPHYRAQFQPSAWTLANLKTGSRP